MNDAIAGESPNTGGLSFQASPHHPYLLRCLELARIAGAAVEPNPRVGAVVVHQGRIIGEGAHAFLGGPHAEVNAILSVQNPELLPQSTLYVSLEPCNHHGTTPPCTNLIQEKRIPHVVVGGVDPNPQMSGKSIVFLRGRGVRVEVCEDEGPFRALNRHFWVNQREGRPYVTLKWAESADGLIAGMRGDGLPEPRPISCMEANRLLHSLRHESQAICIGKNTALIDDPSLTTRHWPGRDPVRIVFDQNLELPRSLRIFQKGSWIVINSKLDQVEGDGRFWKVADSRDLRALLSRLYSECKIGSILVEGGRNLSQQFLDAGIWDEVVRCVSPVNLHSGVKAPRLKGGLVPTESLRVGTDLMEQYFR